MWLSVGKGGIAWGVAVSSAAAAAAAAQRIGDTARGARRSFASAPAPTPSSYHTHPFELGLLLLVLLALLGLAVADGQLLLRVEWCVCVCPPIDSAELSSPRNRQSARTHAATSDKAHFNATSSSLASSSTGALMAADAARAKQDECVCWRLQVAQVTASRAHEELDASETCGPLNRVLCATSTPPACRARSGQGFLHPSPRSKMARH